MVCTSSLSVLSSTNCVPLISGSRYLYKCDCSVKFSIRRNQLFRNSGKRLNAAGLSEIELDIDEDPKDRWATNGVAPEEFMYGKWDGHHTYHEGDEEEGTFWGLIAKDYEAVGPPTGFQGLVSWGFIPVVAAAMYFQVPMFFSATSRYTSVTSLTRFVLLSNFELLNPMIQGDYLFIGAALFIVVFCIIEMDKPSEPHNFEPQIYNMERGSRDKLIADYNTMDIWDFNEKYGDLWDFTLKKDDIMKR